MVSDTMVEVLGSPSTPLNLRELAQSTCDLTSGDIALGRPSPLGRPSTDSEGSDGEEEPEEVSPPEVKAEVKPEEVSQPDTDGAVGSSVLVLGSPSTSSIVVAFGWRHHCSNSYALANMKASGTREPVRYKCKDCARIDTVGFLVSCQ